MKLTNLQESLKISIKDLETNPEIRFISPSGNYFACVQGLTSLDGAPFHINGVFDCSYNKLTSLEFGPQVVQGSFDCSYNKLTSLDFCRYKVGGDFICRSNKITSLIGIDELFEEINGDFCCGDNPIREGGLGLLLIKGISKVRGDNINDTDVGMHIIARYVGKPDALYDCQQELINNNLERYAEI